MTEQEQPESSMRATLSARPPRRIIPYRRLKLILTILIPVTVLSLIINISLMIKSKSLSIFTSSKIYNTQQVESLEEDSKQSLLEDMKSRLSSGTSATTLLREYFPDQIVYVDNGGYVFTDIISTLNRNSHNGTYTTLDDGEITYSENGFVVSHKGIDLSRYQGSVDFSQVKNDEIEYAMIRCGYRSYGTGTLTEDTSFSTYITDALQNNIACGVYFFSQAVNETEAVEEADFVLDQIRPYNVTYPVVIDVEEILNDSYRQENLTKDELTDIIIAFCERIQSQGYTPMIYANLKYFAGKVDLTRLEDYEKWFAYYDDEPYFPYEISMWQYTDSGSVSGVSGSVDLNISYKTWSR